MGMPGIPFVTGTPSRGGGVASAENERGFLGTFFISNPEVISFTGTTHCSTDTEAVKSSDAGWAMKIFRDYSFG